MITCLCEISIPNHLTIAGIDCLEMGMKEKDSIFGNGYGYERKRFNLGVSTLCNFQFLHMFGCVMF